ncbi:SERTA domain-containing protein 3 [Denticeps clupeoides]|uniref:SERTA domain-containing protein 3 n=1 Tax=Denticeps clupeoides TaxID=299321 RepID=UPI0010A2DAD9|nr:SERTA domain-containing protein 3 [Denticeps clupeoides]
MAARGQKRKLPSDADGHGAWWDHQRQSVLDISLDKFQRDQALVEPSLRRSVLISNTLRQIQSEDLALIRSLPNPEGSLSSPFCNSSDFSLLLEDSGDEWMSGSSEEDVSLSTAISSILKELDGAVEGGGLEATPPHRMPLGSIENLPVFEHGAKRDPWKASRPSEDVDISHYAVPQSLAQERLVLDIHTSALEPEGSQELVKFLPLPICSPYSCSSGASVKELHELEHIMEILVES